MQKLPPDGNDSACCMVKSQLFYYFFTLLHTLGSTWGQSTRCWWHLPCVVLLSPNQDRPGLDTSSSLCYFGAPGSSIPICKSHLPANSHGHQPLQQKEGHACSEVGGIGSNTHTPTVTHTPPGPHQPAVLSLRYGRAAAPAHTPQRGAGEEEPLDPVSLTHSPSFSYCRPASAAGCWAEPTVALSQRFIFFLTR